MVHSAVKRKRSSEGLSEDVSREQSVAIIQPAISRDISATDTTHTPENEHFSAPIRSGPEDPRPIVLALLHFLSDTELFSLVTTRLAQASPYDPPLFLTSFCIAGLHNFFLPLRSATETIPTSSPSPFAQIPTIYDEKGRIRGRMLSAATKTRVTALLVSIATLVNFLSPHELRLLIKARISISQAPHNGVGWFLEFMQSGGDCVPRGKRILDTRKAKQRERFYEKQEEARRSNDEKLTQDVSEDQQQVAATNSAPNFTVPPADTVLLYDEVDLEDGEISSSEPPHVSIQLPQPESGKTASVSSGKKESKKRRRAARKKALQPDFPHPTIVAPSSAMSTVIVTGQPSKPPFPGMATPFFVEPFQPPPNHPALAGSQTSFQI